MKKQISLFIALTLGFLTYSQASQNYATTPPDFVKLSYEEVNKAVESEDRLINAERIKTIGPEYTYNLLAQLQSSKLSNDNKTLAIYFLSTLSPANTNSINYLIQNIDFRATRFDPIDKGRIQIERWGEYPAVDALERIGKSTVNPILNDLPSENSELRRSLLCKVLKIVLRFYLAAPGDK